MKLSEIPASDDSSAASGVTSDPLRDRRGSKLENPRAQRREESRLPGDARGIGGAGGGRDGFRRQHDEEHVREERHRVDAVRQRTDIGPARAPGQPLRLQRVSEVADEHRDRRAGKDAAVDEIGRKAEHAAAHGVDQQQLDQVIDCEAEEAVDVAAHRSIASCARNSI
jgi:hypothetical protein